MTYVTLLPGQAHLLLLLHGVCVHSPGSKVLLVMGQLRWEDTACPLLLVGPGVMDGR